MHRAEFVSLIAGAACLPSRSHAAKPSPRFEFHSAFWINLHHRLYQTASWADAARNGLHVREPGTTLLGTERRLPGREGIAWANAVETYRRTFVTPNRDLLFDAGLTAINAELSVTPRESTPTHLPPAIADALERTEAAYAAHLWPEDDRVNARWIERVAPGVRAYERSFMDRLARTYDTTWPALPFRIDVARYAYVFGAYTTLESGFVHTVMESGDPRLQGLAAIEIAFHEASHAVVFPDEGTIGKEIADAARRGGHPEPDQFWHAVIFFSAGALAEEFFGAAGHRYRMYAETNGLFSSRVWPHYLLPLRDHWLPYMERGGDLRIALDRCVADVRLGRA